MFRYIKENVDPHDDGSIKDYLNKLLDGQAGDRSGKIYGLGHAVYTMSDPRAVLLKKYAQRMAELKGYADDFALLQKVEELGLPMVMERKHSDTPMCANVDMYSGLVYAMLGIPEEVFTPLFASARIAGWCANLPPDHASGLPCRHHPRGVYPHGPARRASAPVRGGLIQEKSRPTWGRLFFTGPGFRR